MSKKIFFLLLVLGALFAGSVNMAFVDAELPQVPLVTSGLTDDGDQLVFGNNFTLASGSHRCHWPLNYAARTVVCVCVCVCV
ncbi:MAG: hypothetical protein WCL57_06650, partial [Chloroflexota bacterium]